MQRAARTLHIPVSTVKTASSSAISPGSATTPAPLRPIVCRTAVWSSRGMCRGPDIGSQ
jgi:hypothetical protein